MFLCGSSLTYDPTLRSVEDASRQGMTVEEKSSTTWYISQYEEDSIQQFFKEECVNGAVYDVHLKKISYHSTLNDVHTKRSTTEANANYRSTFYMGISNDDREDWKGRLQWRLTEVRVIRYGTLEKLIEAFSVEDGDVDSSFINVFFSTYRSFSNVREVLDAIFKRYKAINKDGNIKQQKKELLLRTIHLALLVWLDSYSLDFREPPAYSCLRQLMSFASKHKMKSEVAKRARDRLDDFFRDDEEESSGMLLVGDTERLADFNHVKLELNYFSGRASSYHFQSPRTYFHHIPSKTFAEQLTYMDAELFKSLIPYQCLGSCWSQREKRPEQAATVLATVNNFNAVSCRVMATILKEPHLTLGERARVVEKWIDIAQELRILKNFSSLKAIISALQAQPIFRLRNVWKEVNSEMLEILQGMEEIFSEENNQKMCRELLYMEGSAKHADPESCDVIRGHARKKSNGSLSGWGSTRRKTIPFGDTKTAMQGTIPYLGTFLTDLIMIDTALPDRMPEDRALINFEKKRKEFEILVQIRLLQSAAQLYRIKLDASFNEWFNNMRIYDTNESFMLSCEIEPATQSTPCPRRKDHKKKSSFEFFNVLRPLCYPDELPAFPALPYNGHTRTPQSPIKQFSHLDDASLCSNPSPTKQGLRHAVSSDCLRGHTERRPSASSTRFLDGGLNSQESSERLVAKVILDTSDNHFSNLYKSIVIENRDHTKDVLHSVFSKYNIDANVQEYSLFQILATNKEFRLPDKGNIFYAITTSVPEIRLVVRKCDRETTAAKVATTKIAAFRRRLSGRFAAIRKS